MRNGVEFNEGVFIFSGKNKISVPLSPDTDCYFLYPEHSKNLKKILNLDFDLPEYTLIFRDNGEEFIFLEENNFLMVEKPDEGEVRITGRLNKPSKKIKIDFKKTVEKNKDIVEKMKKEAIDFLLPYKDKKAVIPLSGGKDSQAVLDIAVNVWDKEKLLCIQADTGFDFEENRRHAEYLCKEYAVNLEVLELNLDKKGEPDFSRWCTFEKTEKMYEIAKKWGAEVYLMGDRDAESKKRRRKPRKRELQGILHLFPIKFLSTAHIQVLIKLSGKNINPLYKKGYWRTGCKSCPFLTQWGKILQF
jgi:3'-phosphoadenosine 5'-phosphosulfate sulfotransferase (PAPS reductase)/FAD synthetase